MKTTKKTTVKKPLSKMYQKGGSTLKNKKK